MCGGTVEEIDALPDGRGLSPRVRGNRIDRHRITQVFGSIPACAGEPLEVIRMSLQFRVYPRVCGGTSAAADGSMTA